jgi:integrase
VLGHRPALQITRRELQDEVIRPKMAKAPRVTTQLLSRIRCAYAHAIEQGRLPDDFISPTLGIKGAPQVRRKRVLMDAELATFLKWLPHSPYSRTVREALSLVLLTGCHSGEVVAALWRDVYLDRGVWTIRETKNCEAHDVMLPKQAVELLKSRQGMDQVYVFPSPRGGWHVAQKVLGFAQYYARQRDGDKPAPDPIEVPWTVHDLRRTVATGLAKLGCPRVVQDRVLNHVDSSVSAIYDRHHYDAEARAWLQKWADYLEALTARNVVPLRAAWQLLLVQFGQDCLEQIVAEVKSLFREPRENRPSGRNQSGLSRLNDNSRGAGHRDSEPLCLAAGLQIVEQHHSPPSEGDGGAQCACFAGVE